MGIPRNLARLAQKQLDIGQILRTGDFGVRVSRKDEFDWMADEFAGGCVIGDGRVAWYW